VALLTLTAVGKHRSELESGLDEYAASLNSEVNFPTTSLGSVGGKQPAAVLVLQCFYEYVFAESMY
jgi:hypothetical protein